MEEVIESRNQQIAKKKFARPWSCRTGEGPREDYGGAQAWTRSRKTSFEGQAERKQHQLDIQAQIVAKEVTRDQRRKFEEHEHELALESERNTSPSSTTCSPTRASQTRTLAGKPASGT